MSLAIYRDGVLVTLTDEEAAEQFPPQAPVRTPPPDISDRQFGEGLWTDGIISYEEYIAFTGVGAIPPPLQVIIDTLPDDDTGRPTPRKIATGMVMGATTYRRDEPLVDYVRQVLEAGDPLWTPAHLDERWRAWGTPG